MDYYPWLDDDEDDSFAWIDRCPRELMEKDYLLNEGVPASAWFPSNATYALSPNNGVKLTDAIPNTLGLLLISPRLRELLEREAPETSIEYLPVAIKNHKDKLVSPPYAIANILGSVECVDKVRSDFTIDEIDKTQIRRFRRLVLDESRIPADRKIFRLGESTSLIIVREDLAQKIVDADMTGMMFLPMADYGAEFRGRGA